MVDRLKQLDKLTATELKELIQRGQELMNEKKKDYQEEGKEKILEIAKEYDLHVKFIANPKKRKYPKKPPRYCNPNDKTQTWNGIGAQPKWFKKAVAEGFSEDDLLIENQADSESAE